MMFHCTNQIFVICCCSFLIVTVQSQTSPKGHTNSHSPNGILQLQPRPAQRCFCSHKTAQRRSNAATNSLVLLRKAQSNHGSVLKKKEAVRAQNVHSKTVVSLSSNYGSFSAFYSPEKLRAKRSPPKLL